MGQVNVNPGTNSSGGGDGSAGTIFGMGMMMFFTMAAFVVLALAVGWFVVRPMMMSSGTPTINVTVPAQQPAAQQPAPAAPAAPARP